MLSEKGTQVIDITKQIRDIMLSADVKEGILLVKLPAHDVRPLRERVSGRSRGRSQDHAGTARR